jgi:hypothetical protein
MVFDVVSATEELIATDSTKSSKKMIEKSKGCRRRCERECM